MDSGKWERIRKTFSWTLNKIQAISVKKEEEIMNVKRIDFICAIRSHIPNWLNPNQCKVFGHSKAGGGG